MSAGDDLARLLERASDEQADRERRIDEELEALDVGLVNHERRLEALELRLLDPNVKPIILREEPDGRCRYALLTTADEYWRCRFMRGHASHDHVLERWVPSR